MKDMIIGSWLALTAVLAAVSPAAAQNTGAGASSATPKIAYLNSQEILRNTAGYAQAESTFNKELEAFQKTYDLEQQKLRTRMDSLVQDYERQATMLPASQKAAKQKALQEEEQKARQQIREMGEKMDGRQRELLEPIQRRIQSVIEGTRASGGYLIIWDISAPNNGIVTADPSLDLTKKIIDQLK